MESPASAGLSFFRIQVHDFSYVTFVNILLICCAATAVLYQ